jgi:hypothetical protein
MFLSIPAIAGVVSLITVALFFYVLSLIITNGSSPQGKTYDKFVQDICNPKGRFSFLRTVLTYGYLKRTTKLCLRHWHMKLFPQPTAELGKPCPDAALVTLNGEARSLLRDYVQKESHIPLILNFGSYT